MHKEIIFTTGNAKVHALGNWEHLPKNVREYFLVKVTSELGFKNKKSELSEFLWICKSE